MPAHSLTPTDSPRPHLTRRTSAILAAAVVAALAGGVATVSVAQSARADEIERHAVTAAIVQTSSVDSDQLDVYGDVLAARVAYQDKIAAAEAAFRATPAGAQQTAREMSASQYGWGDDQFSCLVSLWERESNWNVNSLNASSGAAGIPQALPGEKMATAGADWQTNPATQITWGLGYIAAAYGTPCAAWGHSESFNWY